MPKPNRSQVTDASNEFRFNLAGLIIFSLCLAAGGALTGKLLTRSDKIVAFAQRAIPTPVKQDRFTYTHQGPWGELLTQNIELERPAEIVATEVNNPSPTRWVFNGQDVPQIKKLFGRAGLSAQQVDAALTPDRTSRDGHNTIFQPSEDFILSLDPQARQKLYTSLSGMGVNTHIDWPYIFPGNSVATVLSDARLHQDDASLLKQLVYPVGNATQFSDYELLINHIPTPERRLAMARVLSRQWAVLATLFIRPDTDIDKMVGYWSQMENVRADDIRPLLESVTQLPNGGSVSLMYLLPPFARERLYTFPMPSQGDAVMDCHWTTFNFGNAEPDNRFNDPAFTFQFLEKTYYSIGQPGRYGDLVLLTNEKSECKHSAVYIADDLVFTKYGSNYTQPWIIVRIPVMLEKYPALKATYYRKRTS